MYSLHFCGGRSPLRLIIVTTHPKLLPQIDLKLTMTEVLCVNACLNHCVV